MLISETKQRIIKEAAEIVCTKGIKAMTMDGVANALGISKRTLYEHFTDKDSLIKAILCSKGKNGNTDIETIAKESKNVLQLFFRMYEMGDEGHLRLSIKLADEIKRYHPKIFEETVQQSITEGIDFLKGAFNRGVEEKLFLENLDCELFANLITAQTGIFLFSKNALLKKYSLATIYKASFFSFLRGISTTKGIKIIDKYLEKQI